MNLGRVVPSLALAVVASFGASAFAETRSPHAGGVVIQLQRFREKHAAELDAKTLARVDSLLATLDRDGGSFRARLKALAKGVQLARHLPEDVRTAHTSAFDLSVFGVRSEIEANLDAVQRRVPAATKSREAMRRKALQVLGQCRAALASSQSAATALAQLALLVRAHDRLENAVERLGKLDVHVIATYVECDSIGLVGTPYVRGVNARFAFLDEVADEGYLRRFLVYVPQSALRQLGTPGAVVVMHHGTSGTDAQFLTHSGWKEKAEETGLVAAFAQGLLYRLVPEGYLATKFHDYSLETEIDPAIKPAGYPASAQWPADDVRYERVLLNDLETGLLADPDRLYASGFSNGAGFAMRLSVELSDRYEAIGCTGGGPHVDATATPLRLIPVSVLSGTLDDRILGQINGSLSPSDPAYVSEVPLAPAELLALPTISVGVVGNTLTAFQLAVNPHVETLTATSTAFHFATPKPSNSEGNAYDFTVLADVEHEYPNGANNPNGFVAADMFWTFFEGP